MSISVLHQLSQKLIDALESKVYGLPEVINEVVVTVLSHGHALLTGAPGVAKTTLVRNLASSLGCGYNRIQFTPDLTPFDIIGGDTIEFDKVNPDLKRIVFAPGPVFTSFILADEINRASPRTQAALLESMQERQVTVGKETRILPKPFYVFATQNPLENEGTFPLPEAQLDRFLLNIEVPYPSFEAELKVSCLPQVVPDLLPLFDANELANARKTVEEVKISNLLLEGILRVIRNTRPEVSTLNIAKNYLAYGASPRASQALVVAAKAKAVIAGRDEVEIQDIMQIAPAVLRHRCISNFKAATDNLTPNKIIQEILAETIL